MTINSRVPTGWEGVASAMAVHPAVRNANTLASWMDRRGYSPHKESGALIRRAAFECAMESLSPTSIGFVLRNGARGAQEHDFTDQQRKHLAGTGAAMVDGSFPIQSVQDLRNAIRAIGRASNPDAVKAHIKARAKALGATKELPEDWK